jgi:acyl dehydratase
MPITDLKKALAYEYPEDVGAYTSDDVILYHLGVGAGVPATDSNELEYTYEKNLKVLPTFSTVIRVGPAVHIFDMFNNVPGMDINPAMMLHGEQETVIHQPLSPAAKVRTKARIANIYDMGKAALAILEVNASTPEGDRLYTNRYSIFLRGEGGFGGDKEPKAGNEPPDREPDGVVESPTLPQQCLLYRLNGDKNPLHVDPEAAKKAGFDAPIILGLCSYGIVCKAVIDGALDGDVSQVARYKARFHGVAYPGETYLTSYWREGNTILIETKSKESGTVIISNAAITCVDS